MTAASRRPGLSFAIAVLLVMVGGLLFAAPGALAARNHVLSAELGVTGSGAGGLELAAPVLEPEGGGLLEKGGSGVAVNNETHDVYVADTGNHRVDEFSPSGAFILAFGFGVLDGEHKLEVCTTVCQAGLAGSEPGELESPTFIAVDNSPSGEGDVYVADPGDGLISKFTAQGALVSGWGNHGAGEAPNGQLAGPPTEAGPPVEPFIGSQLDGIAVAPGTGDLWVAANTGQGPRIYRFEQETGSFGTRWEPAGSQHAGLAVNSAEELYDPDGLNVNRYTSEGGDAGELFSSEATFTGLAVDPASEALFFDSGSYVGVVTGSCPPPVKGCVVAESFGSGVVSGGAGLAVDPHEAVVFLADAGSDRVDEFIEEPAAAPLVSGDSVSDVTSTSAVLSGEVDPRSLATEHASKYRFVYGPCPALGECASAPYPDSTPAGQLPPSFDTETIPGALIQGLAPDTTYHFRLIAENEQSELIRAPGEGSEVLFTTQGPGGPLVLADDRRWEMVSPVQKYGALIEPIGEEGVIQAAVDGDAITYHANAPIEPEPQGAMNEVQILSARAPGGGWSSHDIEAPHGTTGKPEGENDGQPYRFFSEDLSTALLQPAGAYEPALSEESSETSPMLRTDFLSQDVEDPCLPQAGMHCYRPLVTGKEPYANIPPNTKFGETFAGERLVSCPQGGPYCGPRLEGASPDGQHVVFESDVQLTNVAQTLGIKELYEWNDGRITLVSELPDHNTAGPSNWFGAAHGTSGLQTRNAISPDGSRVVWTAENNTGIPTIYLRVMSPSGGGEPTTIPVGEGEFQGANRETTEIFYQAGGDLYEYDVATGETTTIAAEANVLGTMIGASENGEYVYFVADGTLGKANEGAVNGDCPTSQGKPTTTELCNLYVYHAARVGLIAVLSGQDRPDWDDGGESTGLAELVARVSPNGRFLAFMSDRDLTGFDSRDAATGLPDEEAYLYDAQTGRLACASCEPTGARPHGVYYNSGGIEAGTRNMPIDGGDRIWEPESSLAADLPAGIGPALDSATYQSRSVSDSGRLFFNSDDALVPDDTNGTWDVYEYEPEGVGPEGAECGLAVSGGGEIFKPAKSAVVEGRTVQEGAGCVGLISSGTSSGESAFLDASEKGGDVFFLTAAKLSPQDTDSSYDVYDAHECSALSPCTTPVTAGGTPRACETEAECRPAAGTPAEPFSAPSSSVFSGPGNLLAPAPAAPVTSARKPLTRAQRLVAALKSCRRDKRHAKRAACERAARRAFGARTSSTRPSTDSRARS